jgi:hypothetical protein
MNETYIISETGIMKLVNVSRMLLPIPARNVSVVASIPIYRMMKKRDISEIELKIALGCMKFRIAGPRMTPASISPTTAGTPYLWRSSPSIRAIISRRRIDVIRDVIPDLHHIR